MILKLMSLLSYYRISLKIRQRRLILIFFRKITLGLIFGGRLSFSFIKNKITK